MNFSQKTKWDLYPNPPLLISNAFLTIKRHNQTNPLNVVLGGQKLWKCSKSLNGKYFLPLFIFVYIRCYSKIYKKSLLSFVSPTATNVLAILMSYTNETCIYITFSHSLSCFFHVHCDDKCFVFCSNACEAHDPRFSKWHRNLFFIHHYYYYYGRFTRNNRHDCVQYIFIIVHCVQSHQTDFVWITFYHP